MNMTRSIAEDVAQTLRHEILRGQYRAGERLPSERDLAVRFDANRGAIRESIKKLEQLGIVEVKPGGVRVVPIEDATLEVLGHLLDLEEVPHPPLVGQFFEVISAMVSLSARAAITEASDDQIAQMSNLVQSLKESINDRDAYHNGWR